MSMYNKLFENRATLFLPIFNDLQRIQDIKSSAIIENGHRVWKEYKTLYVDGEDFNSIGEAFEKECTVNRVPLGNGSIAFMKQRELVDFAVAWIEKNRK